MTERETFTSRDEPPGGGSETTLDLPEERALDKIIIYIQGPKWPQNSRRFKITPAMATKLLERYNVEGNRKKKPATVKRYVNYMNQNQWSLTGDTIKFSDVATLLDGQHRLIACVKSGKAFITHVVFGIDRDAFWFMDRGKNRFGADGLFIAGYKDHPTQLQQAARWLKMFKEDTVKLRPSFEPKELEEIVRKHPALDTEYVVAGITVGKKWGQPSGLMAALFHMWDDKNPEVFNSLYASLVSNQKMPERFKAMDKAFAIIKQQGLQSAGRVNDVWRAGVLVKAWNLIIGKRKGKGWRGAASAFTFDVKQDPFPEFKG
jgi:hypothetical protein